MSISMTTLEAAENDGVTGLIIEDPKSITRVVQSVALATATAKQKPSPWTKNMFKLYLCLSCAVFSACINGFQGTVMGGINGYKQYREYFGFDPLKGTPSDGIVYSIYSIGGLVGAFAAGPASDYKGRKWGLFTGSLIIIIFVCVQATSQNLPQFMAARFMLGFGNAICQIAGPVYVLEMAHPSYRGVITGIYNCFYFIGSTPGTFVPYGTSRIEGSQAWRVPLWLQMVFAGLVLFGSPFLPESPRWLIANNRHREALAIMVKYHGDGNRDSPIVQLEYKEMNDEISRTGSDKRWWDYRQLFNTPEARYRSMLVVSMAFIGQWAGNASISYYYPQMLAGAGITDTQLQLFLNGLQNPLFFGGAILGAVFTDKWGRRKQILTATAFIALIFVIITPLNATNLYTDDTGTLQARSPAQAKAIIALTYIFGFAFSVGYTPLQLLYPVECLSFETRAKGMGMLALFVGVTGFYNTFVTGIAFTNIGWRYYFVFIFWDVLAFAFIYFYFVETRNRTLEELKAVFSSQYPVRTSLAKSEIVIRGDEIIVHVVDKVVY